MVGDGVRTKVSYKKTTEGDLVVMKAFCIFTVNVSIMVIIL
jgi:hypothetical protein